MNTPTLKMKIAAFVAAAGLFSVLAQAQHRFDPDKKAKAQTEWMKTELSLSGDQTAKVEAINLKYAQEQKALHEKNRPEMKVLRDRQQTELKAVLSEEQLKKLEAKRAERKEKFKEERKKGHSHHKFDGDKNSRSQTEWMKTELSLSADQATKVEAINSKYTQERKTLHEKNREEMKAVRDRQQAELKTVLSEEQLKKLEAKRAERKEKFKEGRKKGCRK